MPRGGRFTYEVVTSNGVGVHARFDTFPKAKVGLSRIAHAYLLPDVAFEIQRVRHLPGGSRQYDMRRRAHWVPWDCKRDHTDREPDHLIISSPESRKRDPDAR